VERGSVTELAALPGTTIPVYYAVAINDSGQVVGDSSIGGTEYATEWSGGKVINLGGLPGFTSSYTEVDPICADRGPSELRWKVACSSLLLPLERLLEACLETPDWVLNFSKPIESKKKCFSLDTFRCGRPRPERGATASI
jgi:probable HAF family extracellular repeat protein